MNQPLVNVRPEQFWCPKHLSPFRRGWPKGYLPATLHLFRAATEMPAIQDAAHNDANELEAAILRFAPICCFVSREVRAAAYEAGGIKA